MKLTTWNKPQLDRPLHLEKVYIILNKIKDLKFKNQQVLHRNIGIIDFEQLVSEVNQPCSVDLANKDV